MAPKRNYPINAVEKTLNVVESMVGRSVSVTGLADELDMNTSTVYNHLKTLEREGYVVQRDDRYELSHSFLNLGGRQRYHSKLYREAHVSVASLAEETGEVASLLVEQNGKGIYLYLHHGEQSLDYDNYVGKQTHLHSSALGKSILAFLPEERVREIINRHGLPSATEHTITDEEALFDELADVRERGFAWDKEEGGLGVCCVSAPIILDDGTVLGAVSLTGPVSRMQGDRFQEELPKAVRDTANVIELNVKYSDL